jgi:Flp pilus assembly protein TadB
MAIPSAARDSRQKLHERKGELMKRRILVVLVAVCFAFAGIAHAGPLSKVKKKAKSTAKSAASKANDTPKKVANKAAPVAKTADSQAKYLVDQQTDAIKKIVK